ncbi:hypothetical protein NP493_1980g00017 [Ridgeia piscesae]|uniref:NACHT domain-containing protein n=1 Tax=Ridgeia piscesae TaxID=27915 RepID=A0AAD9N4D7_RIDPI|nr:hypothetical protein NP493_1980g00017 [Ridgeia piscesae]
MGQRNVHSPQPLLERFRDKEYVAWLKASQALLVTAEALYDYCEKPLRQYHQTLCANLPKPPCTGPCGRDRGIPCWGNADETRWDTNFWEVAKVFMAYGKDVSCTGPADTDPLGLLQLVVNCDLFDTFITFDRQPVRDVRTIRNDLFHSPDFRMSKSDLKSCIDTMIKLLEDPVDKLVKFVKRHEGLRKCFADDISKLTSQVKKNTEKILKIEESAKAKLRSKFIVMVSRTTLDESFVQLRLQDSKEESLPDVLTYRDVEYLERCRQSAQEVKLEQLFSKLKNDDIVPKKVLIKGRAGVGKTTLIDFMLREWATRHSWPQFDYIFVIKLREVSERQWSIGDLLFLGLNLSSKEKKAVLDEIREHSNRTLVIVDSLDEFPLFLYSQSQFPFGTEVNLSEMISIIINCTWLPDSTVVVTSRHTDQIPSKVFCRIVDVYGFTMGGIETYVNNFCKENKQLRKFIWKNITTNPNMATFCHTPVQCVFMCNSLKDQFQHSESGSIPDMTTMTQLYVKATYRLAKKLHPRLKPDKGQANLKHVFRILKAPFTKHAQLAKYGMENQLKSNLF